MDSLHRKLSLTVTVSFLIVILINDIRDISQKTQILLQSQILLNDNQNVKNNSMMRIFCMTLTNPNGNVERLDALNDTWAPECDRHVFVAKLEPNASYLAKEYNFLQPKNLELDEYHHLACKMFHTIHDVYLAYPDYDWYLKTDDDTFIFMDNLRDFLSTKNALKPVVYGYHMRPYLKKGYNSGGAGYIISGEAFRRVGAELVKNMSFCGGKCQFEDLHVHRCLSWVNAFPGETIDIYGRERFHLLGFSWNFMGPIQSWLYNYNVNPLLIGQNSTSDTTITFHYIKPIVMRKLHYVYHHYLEHQRNGLKLMNLSRILYEFIDE